MTRGRLASGAAVMFLTVIVATLPGEALLRQLVASSLAPVGLDWAHAHLGLASVRFEQAVIHVPGVAMAIHLDDVELTPSLAAMVRGRRGSPWGIRVHQCQGSADGTIRLTGDITTFELAWREIDLARCELGALAGHAISGRAEGTAQVHLVGGTAHGDGTIAIRDPSWRPGDATGPGGELAAASVRARWHLDRGQLALDGISLVGPDFRASGNARLELAPEPAASRIQARLLVGSARADGPTWPVALGGTLTHPRLVAP